MLRETSQQKAGQPASRPASRKSAIAQQNAEAVAVSNPNQTDPKRRDLGGKFSNTAREALRHAQTDRYRASLLLAC